MVDLARKTLLVTDLDNTLWDWFEAWFQSFSGMLDRLCELSDVPREVLETRFVRSIKHGGRPSTPTFSARSLR